MHICETLEPETWSPDFSGSGQASPTWTRLRYHGLLLANSLEWSEWSDNPVQIILCDACGHDGCSSGGYAHVSRLPDVVLLSAPQLSSELEYPDVQYEAAYVMRKLGAVAIPMNDWNRWRSERTFIPDARRFAPANYAAVADAWILGPGRPDAASVIHLLQERLIGGDTLARDEAISLVASAHATLMQRGGATFEQAIINPIDVGARIETLYFDGPPDWPALAFASDRTYLALDKSHLVMMEM